MEEFHISRINIKDINSDFLLKLIKLKFKKNEENITPMKILSKMGVPLSSQLEQLKFKNYRLHIKKILLELHSSNLIESQKSKHDTLGIKEVSYKLIST